MPTPGFWRTLEPRERTTLLAAAGGWAVDAFDFNLYGLVVPALIALWGISRPAARAPRTTRS